MSEFKLVAYTEVNAYLESGWKPLFSDNCVPVTIAVGGSAFQGTTYGPIPYVWITRKVINV